jgi:aminoglycoside 6'-N-acetyltransferase I
MEVGALPSGVELREAVGEDLSELVELARAFYDEDGFTTSDVMLRSNFEVLIPASGAHVVLARIRGSACGYALTTTDFTLESGRIAELQDLYVRPERRRQGLAAALIGDAVEWARGRSASSLELVVAPNGRDVSELLRYYARRGFVDEGRRLLNRAL